VAKLNVDENPYTAQQYGVLSIPTLILFRGGEERARIVGVRGKDSIEQALLRDVAA
jgi:thioredoxin 1